MLDGHGNLTVTTNEQFHVVIVTENGGEISIAPPLARELAKLLQQMARRAVRERKLHLGSKLVIAPQEAKL